MSATGSHVRCLQTQLLVPRETPAARRSGTVSLVPPFLLFFVLAFQLWVRVESISKGYEVEELRREALHSDKEVRALRLEYEMLLRPSVLAELAQKRLNMTPVPPQRVRKIEEQH